MKLLLFVLSAMILLSCGGGGGSGGFDYPIDDCSTALSISIDTSGSTELIPVDTFTVAKLSLIAKSEIKISKITLSIISYLAEQNLPADTEIDFKLYANDSLLANGRSDQKAKLVFQFANPIRLSINKKYEIKLRGDLKRFTTYGDAVAIAIKKSDNWAWLCNDSLINTPITKNDIFGKIYLKK